MTVGVRPEHLVLGTGGVPGEVVIVEELGSEGFVHVSIAHRGETTSLVVRAEGGTPVARGDRVQIAVSGAVHVFDAAGQRLPPAQQS